MTLTSRSLILAAALLAMPLAGALAQSSNPSGNYGSNKSITASPGTADSTAASGLSTADAPTAPAVPRRAKNPHRAGATGRTVVKGTSSTVAGDAPNTSAAKTSGGVGGGATGK